MKSEYETVDIDKNPVSKYYEPLSLPIEDI